MTIAQQAMKYVALLLILAGCSATPTNRVVAPAIDYPPMPPVTTTSMVSQIPKAATIQAATIQTQPQAVLKGKTVNFTVANHKSGVSYLYDTVVRGTTDFIHWTEVARFPYTNGVISVSNQTATAQFYYVTNTMHGW